MAAKATHYKLTVLRPFTCAGVSFRPDAVYEVTAEVFKEIEVGFADAIEKASSLKKG
jgi:hypothetical protein